MSSSFIPGSQQRYLRACMVCAYVQTHTNFMKDGCPNCESFLELTNSSDAVQECTSQVFEGLVTLADPSSSWVARWLRLDKYVPGVYATKVVGTLPEEVMSAIEDSGRVFHARDGTADDDER